MRPEIEFSLIFGCYSAICGAIVGYLVRGSMHGKQLKRVYKLGENDGLTRGILLASGSATTEKLKRVK